MVEQVSGQILSAQEYCAINLNALSTWLKKNEAKYLQDLELSLYSPMSPEMHNEIERLVNNYLLATIKAAKTSEEKKAVGDSIVSFFSERSPLNAFRQLLLLMYVKKLQDLVI